MRCINSLGATCTSSVKLGGKEVSNLLNIPFLMGQGFVGAGAGCVPQNARDCLVGGANTFTNYAFVVCLNTISTSYDTCTFCNMFLIHQ